MIIAVDPSNKEHTAYIIMDDNYKPLKFDMVGNEEMIRILEDNKGLHVAIEMVASYGLPVGKDIFDTCVFIGRMIEHCSSYTLIYRKDVKMNLCLQTKGVNDSVIRQALVNRFAKHDFRSGKGTKKNPDFFYGFKGDQWAAYAVGVTYLDMEVLRNE